jgi:hypothetical protein
VDGNLFIRAHKFFIKKLRLELWPVVLAGFISAVVTKQTEDETRVKPARTSATAMDSQARRGHRWPVYVARSMIDRRAL